MSIGNHRMCKCGASELSPNGCQSPCHVVFHSKEFGANLTYSLFCALKY